MLVTNKLSWFVVQDLSGYILNPRRSDETDEMSTGNRDKVIKQAVEKLNHRPRKCLNFRTPYDVLFKTRTVALRT